VIKKLQVRLVIVFVTLIHVYIYITDYCSDILSLRCCIQFYPAEAQSVLRHSFQYGFFRLLRFTDKDFAIGTPCSEWKSPSIHFECKVGTEKNYHVLESRWGVLLFEIGGIIIDSRP
jgi:hypothetical protein